MNKERRKAIIAVIATLEDIQMEIEQAAQTLTDIGGEEQDYLDAMPNSIQQGAKGEAAQQVIDALESNIDELESFDLESVIHELRETLI